MNNDQLKKLLSAYKAPEPSPRVANGLWAKIARWNPLSEADALEAPTFGVWNWQLAAYAIAISLVITVSVGLLIGFYSSGGILTAGFFSAQGIGGIGL